MQSFDYVIIGAGIVGLAHAVEASRHGKSVLVLDRSERARGASIRNFGMVWPVGQPAGIMLDRALRSREVWLQIAAEAGFWMDLCGSVHLAYHDDEADVLREFSELARIEGRDVQLLSPEEVHRRACGVRPEGLRAGLWSSSEACVDSREAIASIASWLIAQRRAEVWFRAPVSSVEPHAVTLADGRRIEAGHIVVCSGDDFRTLLPEAFDAARLTRCKLQMMRTHPQPDGWRIGPHLAAGLTQRHYKAWQSCPSLKRVSERVTRESPEFDTFGIHVLVSQNGLGEVVIGDSHEYGPEFPPGSKAEIDELILRYLDTFLQTPLPGIAQRWTGVYAKCLDGRNEYVARVDEGLTVVTGLGGAGMSTSFGLAQEVLGLDRDVRAWSPGGEMSSVATG